MPDQPDPVLNPEPESAASTPVLIPVTADDAARERRRRWLVWAVPGLILAALAGWIYKRATDPLKAQESFDAGKRLMTVARYPQAILSFDRTIALQPDFGEAYLMRARAHVSLFDTPGSIPDFTRGIALRPRDPIAYIDRGRAYLLLRKYPEAAADASSAIAIETNLAPAYNLRATAIRDSGNPQQAMADFDRAVELSPDADNYFQRGATYQLLGDYPHAVADFDQTIAFAPDQAQAYFARAEAEKAMGDVKAAQRDHLHGRVLDGK